MKSSDDEYDSTHSCHKTFIHKSFIHTHTPELSNHNTASKKTVFGLDDFGIQVQKSYLNILLLKGLTIHRGCKMAP